MPIVLNGPVNKGKLDKKIVEVEEDISDFYLNGSRNWKEAASSNHSTNFSPFESKEYYEYTYEERFHDEMIQDEYEPWCVYCVC